MKELLCKEKPGIGIVGESGDHTIQPGESDRNRRFVECGDQVPIERPQPSIAPAIEVAEVVVIRQAAPAFYIRQPPRRECEGRIEVQRALEILLGQGPGILLKCGLAAQELALGSQTHATEITYDPVRLRKLGGDSL